MRKLQIICILAACLVTLGGCSKVDTVSVESFVVHEIPLDQLGESSDSSGTISSEITSSDPSSEPSSEGSSSAESSSAEVLLRKVLRQKAHLQRLLRKPHLRTVLLQLVYLRIHLLRKVLLQQPPLRVLRQGVISFPGRRRRQGIGIWYWSMPSLRSRTTIP